MSGGMVGWNGVAGGWVVVRRFVNGEKERAKPMGKRYKPLGDAKGNAYAHAQVVECARYHALLSYGTTVCRAVLGDGGGDGVARFVRHWSGYSATTLKHVNAFRAWHGLPELTKKDWEAMPVVGC